jgi:hypothetical protein
MGAHGFGEAVVDVAGERQCRAGGEELHARRDEREQLHVDAGRIHSLPPARRLSSAITSGVAKASSQAMRR